MRLPIWASVRRVREEHINHKPSNGYSGSVGRAGDGSFQPDLVVVAEKNTSGPKGPAGKTPDGGGSSRAKALAYLKR
jgi:hypothetical protein